MVAVKFPMQGRGRELVNEANTIHSLRGLPGVIKFYGICFDPLFIVCELKKGLYFKEYYPREGLVNSLNVAVDLIYILRNFYELGWSHCDIEDESVFVVQEGEGYAPYFLDFSLAYRVPDTPSEVDHNCRPVAPLDGSKFRDLLRKVLRYHPPCPLSQKLYKDYRTSRPDQMCLCEVERLLKEYIQTL